MLINISNITQNDEWSDLYLNTYESTFNNIFHNSSKSSDNPSWSDNDKGWKLEKLDQNEMITKYGIDQDNWYKRDIEYQKYIGHRTNTLPNFNFSITNQYEEETIPFEKFDRDNGEFKIPIFFEDESIGGAHLKGYNSPLHNTRAFNFELDEFQRTIDNKLIIDFSLTNNYFRFKTGIPSDDAPKQVVVQNTPERLFFNISMNTPNSSETNFSFSYPSGEENNVWETNRKESYTIDFSKCDQYNENGIIDVYFSFKSIPLWTDKSIGEDVPINDPEDEKNFRYSSDYKASFDMLDLKKDEIDLTNKNSDTIIKTIKGSENDNNGFDSINEIYEFNLSDEIININSLNNITDLVNIKYTDKLRNSNLIISDISVLGKGSYSKISLNASAKNMDNNEYSIIIDDVSYFDPIKKKTIINPDNNNYTILPGIVKNNMSNNINDGFEIILNANGYSSRIIKIDIPFLNSNIVKIENNLDDNSMKNFNIISSITKPKSWWGGKYD